MGYEMEITERLENAVYEALKAEMFRGWSLEQLLPMLNNAVKDAVEEIEAMCEITKVRKGE